MFEKAILKQEVWKSVDLWLISSMWFMALYKDFTTQDVKEHFEQNTTGKFFSKSYVFVCMIIYI